jgi:hypothetical protein
MNDSLAARVDAIPLVTEWNGKGPQLIAERGVFTVRWDAPEQVQFEFDMLRVGPRSGRASAASASRPAA